MRIYGGDVEGFYTTHLQFIIITKSIYNILNTIKRFEMYKFPVEYIIFK